MGGNLVQDRWVKSCWLHPRESGQEVTQRTRWSGYLASSRLGVKPRELHICDCCCWLESISRPKESRSCDPPQAKIGHENELMKSSASAPTNNHSDPWNGNPTFQTSMTFFSLFDFFFQWKTLQTCVLLLPRLEHPLHQLIKFLTFVAVILY